MSRSRKQSRQRDRSQPVAAATATPVATVATATPVATVATSATVATAASPSQRRQPRRALAGVIVLTILAALLAHWGVLAAQALYVDDSVYLYDNPLVQQPGWPSAHRFFTEVRNPSTVPGYYHPLTMVSLMLDYGMGGRRDDLFAFHRTSLLLHVLNGVILAALLFVLFDRSWVAALAGLLFVVHPVTVEPVVWLGQRKALLAATFGFLSLLCYAVYAKHDRRSYLAAALASYVVALLAKPTITSLPAMLLVLDWWPLGRRGRRAVLDKLAFFAVAGAFTVVTVASQVATVEVKLPTDAPLARTLLMLGHKIAFYLAKILWPTDLSAYYPAPDPLSTANPAVVLGLVTTVAVGAAATVAARRGLVAPAAGLLCLLLGLAPILGIIGHSPVYVWDNYLYFPAVGVVVLVGWALDRLWRRAARSLVEVGANRWARPTILALVVLVAAVETVATRRYLGHWRTTEGHYEYVIGQAPGAPILRIGLANLHAEAGRLDDAKAGLEEAIRLYPRNPDAHTALGLVLARQHELDGAVAAYRTALAIEPEDPRTLTNLGLALEQLGRVDEAIESYAKAAASRKPLGLGGHQARVELNLGRALAVRKQFDKAITHLEQAVRHDPTLPEAHYYLAGARIGAGDREASLASLRKAVELRPDYTEARVALGGLLLQLDHGDEAIRQLREAVSNEPAAATAHNALAYALVRLGDPGGATLAWQEAVRLAPDLLDARLNLGSILATSGRTADALEQFRAADRLSPGQARVQAAIEQLDGMAN